MSLTVLLQEQSKIFVLCHPTAGGRKPPGPVSSGRLEGMLMLFRKDGTPYTGRPRRVQVPWWHQWPQFRFYVGVELVHALRYERWGGHWHVACHPVAWLRPDMRPLFDLDVLGNLNMMKPPSRNVIEGPYVAAPDEVGSLYPLLAEHLTCRFYEGDPPTPRETSTLLIFAQEGVFKACLRDRATKRALWVSCPLWSELLAVLEAGLSDEHAVWREDRDGTNDTARRVKPGK